MHYSAPHRDQILRLMEMYSIDYKQAKYIARKRYSIVYPVKFNNSTNAREQLRHHGFKLYRDFIYSKRSGFIFFDENKSVMAKLLDTL